MLRYSEDAVINFSGDPQQTKQEIFGMANQCRWWYQPIFADQSKYLPNQNRQAQVPLFPAVQQTEVKPKVKPEVQQPPTVMPQNEAPKPPEKLEDNVLLQALVVGAGFFVLYKLLS